MLLFKKRAKVTQTLGPFHIQFKVIFFDAKKSSISEDKIYVLYLSLKSLSYYATIVYIKLCTYPCPYGLALGDAHLLSPLPSLSFTGLLCLFSFLCSITTFSGVRSNFREFFSDLVTNIWSFIKGYFCSKLRNCPSENNPPRHSRECQGLKVIACHSYRPVSNKPFPSSKNEPKCKTFVVEMIYQIISMRIKKYIFISIASHLPSLWNRGFFKGGAQIVNALFTIFT